MEEAESMENLGKKELREELVAQAEKFGFILESVARDMDLISDAMWVDTICKGPD